MGSVVAFGLWHGLWALARPLAYGLVPAGGATAAEQGATSGENEAPARKHHQELQAEGHS